MDDTDPYDVRYDPKALEELSKLDKPVARRVARAIDELRSGRLRLTSSRSLSRAPADRPPVI